MNLLHISDDLNRSLSQVHLSGDPSQGDHVSSSQQNTQDSGTDRDATGSQSQPLDLNADVEDDDDVIFSAAEDEDDDSVSSVILSDRSCKTKIVFRSNI